MFLTKLSLSHFKNYSDRIFEFDRNVNAIAGNNGVGKTNLMDAIYYLCLTKSYFNVFDFQNINHNSSFFRLDGQFQWENNARHVVCKVVKGKKKEFIVDDEPIKKLSRHIGLLPVIFIAPDDNVLILGGSEDRRRFIDNTISQIDPEYLQHLLSYNKILKQRNALLKKSGYGGNVDTALLHTYNAKLVEHGVPVYKKRKQLFEELSDILNQFYAELSDSKESVRISYVSQLNKDDYAQLLGMHEAKDRILQRTTQGIHKDDMRFEMDDFKVKKFSSQGQQKSFLLALKFAQFLIIRNHSGKTPILLIDDIFDKLDIHRAENLLTMIGQAPFGQVFITDTNADRLRKIFKGISADIRIFEV